MGADHYRTLVIETGILCNNRCTFCYQRGYRDLKDYPKLVSSSSIRDRMRWGLENGFDEVSLTGGEPTIRPDFLDLVRYARELGYRRVAITTNGWRMAEPEFFAASRTAGITSIGVSVHGPDEATHDQATGHPGSFLRALKTIRHCVATHGTVRLVRLNTFTVVHQGNTHRLEETATVLRAVGVRLMVFQPAILSKANIVDALGATVDLSSVVAAIRKIALMGIRDGFRVKLFNLPPCLFADVLKGIDLDAYERATFRENDRTSPGSESAGEEVGFVRLRACESCELRNFCPGVHITLLPQEDLAAHFEDAIGSVGALGHTQIWIPGTDLLRPTTLHRIVRKARLSGFSDVRLTDGGSAVWGRAGMMAATLAGAKEIVFVHHASDPKSSDRLIAYGGNDSHLMGSIRKWNTLPENRPSPAILVSPGDLALKFLAGEATEPLDGHPWTLHLRAPWRDDDSVKLDLARILKFIREIKWLDRPPVNVVLQVPWPRPWELLWGVPTVISSATGRLRVDLTATVLPTSLTDRRYSVLNWSLPGIGGIVKDDFGRRLKVNALASRVIRVDPITRERLLNARIPYGAQNHS